jgi:hypothetical protein
VVLLRVHQPHHHADHRAGRIELATFLACGVSEIANQVFVGGAKQVGELEVLVAQPVLAEVDD